MQQLNNNANRYNVLKKTVQVSLLILISGFWIYSEADPGVQGLLTAENFSGDKVADREHRLSESKMDAVFEDVTKKHLVSELSSATLTEYDSVNDIPEFMIEFLKQSSPDGEFILADKGAQWQSGVMPVLEIVNSESKASSRGGNQLWIVNKKLPLKQLVFFGMGKGIALLAYNQAGTVVSENIVILKFVNEIITDQWMDTYTDYASTKNEILDFLKKPKRKNDGC
jgi:hypothetical protein